VSTPSLLTSSITLTWPTSEFDGGLAILGYDLQINSGYETDFTTDLHQVSVSASEYTFSPLIAGVEYKFRIAAYNLIESTNKQSDDELNFSDTVQFVIANEPDQITDF
jgi:hypothetical protein